MTVENKKLEEYKQQRQSYLDAAAEFRRKLNQANEEYQALKAKYTAVIRESVQTGANKDAEINALSEKIAEAEKVCQRRRAELDAFSSLDRDSGITKAELVAYFNETVTPQFESERFDAVKERLLRAKREYAHAVLDYHTAVEEFEDLRDAVISEVGDSYRYKLKNINLRQSTDLSDKYFINQPDLYQLMSLKEIPRTVKEVN